VCDVYVTFKVWKVVLIDIGLVINSFRDIKTA